ncbi:MAG: YggS family pyridoxal phosphate-dependent enzyme [Spirochaetia bacterium]|nr:YggS family pyridoxal phosphate-dependent enzyme [Spirochaetia bacterium]
MFEESIRKNLEQLRYDIHQITDRDLRIIAVTKTYPPEVFEICVRLGLNHIGENRIQELMDKNKLYPDAQKKLCIHFIGALQSNKVKYLSGNADTLDALSSVEVMEKINQRWDAPRPLQILLQINCTDESQKSGLNYNEKESIIALARSCIVSDKTKLEGLMTMGPTPAGNYNEQNPQYASDTRRAFQRLKNLGMELENDLSISLPRISMGMSHDYKMAIECGATEIRIGSLLFGDR